MWENFLLNYFSSVAAGVTLAILGLAAYKIYQNTTQSTNVKQGNKTGSNVVTNISKQYNINTTEKQTEEVVKEILTKYDS
jgi:uncharacterized membrane protein YebE (DUF533 family)